MHSFEKIILWAYLAYFSGYLWTQGTSRSLYIGTYQSPDQETTPRGNLIYSKMYKEDGRINYFLKVMKDLYLLKSLP